MSGLGRAGRELQVQLLLDDLRPGIVALSETEVPEDDCAVLKNYKVFYPLATPKRGYRLLLLVREDLATRFNPTVVKTTNMEIWVRLETDNGGVLVGSIYRQWTGAREEEDLTALNACAVLPPRFSATDPSPTLMAQLQVCVNNVARATIRCNKCDKLRVEDLLNEAGFPSINRLVIYTIAMECWRALNLRDVTNGPLNPLGNILFPPSVCSGRTRAAKSGCIPPPTKHQIDSFCWWAYTCWNSSPALRAAATVSAAKRAANELAASAPF